jgi:hypothetical protein
MMTGKIKFICWLAIPLLFATCKEPETSGQLSLKFAFQVDDTTFVPDQMLYTNAADNFYEVNEIKFFISDLKLYDSEGNIISVYDDNSIHYVDYDIASTQVWDIADDIPSGDYTSISFTFGLSQAKNVSNYFTNPPESNMSWPSYLGGGYHYMQINGKWLKDGVSTPFNFHTGIGQLYDGDSITDFVQNSFTVNLPAANFTIEEDASTVMNLVMNINSWFTTPNDYDFNYWGGAIMQNQAAQEVIKENGADVFSVTFPVFK